MTLLLLNITIKISVIVVSGLAATMLLRRRSAAMRHFVLAAALGCAAAAPFVRIIAPAWQSASRLQMIDRPLAILNDGASAAAPPVAHAQSGRSSDAGAVMRALGVIWMTGAGLAVAGLLVGLGRLSWIASRARRLDSGPWADAAADIARSHGLRRTPLVLHSEYPTILGTWGVSRAKVLLPAGAPDWPRDRIRIVLAHEFAHVRRADWIVQMAVDLLCAAYWFNPLVWLASRRLRLESEQACDDAVLRLGVEGSTYASVLVDLARAFKEERPLLVPAAAIARPSSLERRVRAMLNVKLNRDPMSRSASVVAAVVLAAVTVLVAGFGVAAQAQFATVSGTIVDQKGQPLVGATLTLSNAQSLSKYEIKSDATGHYQFVGLPAGDYALLIEFPGFASLKREGLSLNGQTFQVNAVMQVGSLQETIRVVASDAPRQAQVPMVNRFAPKPDSTARFGPCAHGPRGGCIVPPFKVKDVRPIYPAGAQSGSVQIAAIIGPDGRVTSLDVVGDGSGGPADPFLADAAAVAVNQWEFTPTYLDGDPIEVRMKVDVSFAAAK